MAECKTQKLADTFRPVPIHYVVDRYVVIQFHDKWNQSGNHQTYIYRISVWNHQSFDTGHAYTARHMVHHIIGYQKGIWCEGYAGKIGFGAKYKILCHGWTMGTWGKVMSLGNCLYFTGGYPHQQISRIIDIER